MSHGHGPHYVHGAAEVVEKLAPLERRKDPTTAAAIGFLFGPAGVGIYFQSWKDFFVCLGLLLGLLIIVPGIGLVPGWLFSAGYGYYRAQSSNEKLDSTALPPQGDD